MNYYAQERVVKDSVLIGGQPFAVEATWWEQEDQEQKVSVSIWGSGDPITFGPLDADQALVAFAEVFLTIERAIRTESVNAERLVDA
jgi:hypothetical protein